MYQKKYKKTLFQIKNYKNGFSNIFDLNFTLNRGQNLQVSAIGKSIYETKPVKNFYSLILPTNISKYGTANKIT